MAEPSGKLPVTFYGRDYRIPEFTNYSMKNRTYRFVEDGVLYPFGYGLTYGKMAVSEAKWCPERFRVLCTAENITGRDMSEVIMAYKKNSKSHLEVKNCVLCGFTKISLKSGERRRVEIHLWEKTFTVVNEMGERISNGDEYVIWVGTHGPDQRSRELTGTDVAEMNIKLPGISGTI